MQTSARPFLPPRWFIRAAWIVHRAIHRLSGGRAGLRRARAGGAGTLRLRTVGRRTGNERAAILSYIEDGPNLATLAMNGWGEPDPAWWLNLQAQPDAIVELPNERREVTARIAADDERARLWATLDGPYRALDGYAARRSRPTAVVILEPRSA